MWRATLRGLIAHKLRLALSALSVVLGVGFVVGTLVLGDTLQRTFDNLFDEVTVDIDLTVRGKAAFGGADADRPRLPEGVLAQVRAVPGVSAAEGSLTDLAQIVVDGKAIKTQGPPLAVTWAGDISGGVLSAKSGRRPATVNEIAIDAATAGEHGIEVGERIELLLPKGTRSFDVVGIARFGSSDSLAGASLSIFSVEGAQQAFDRVGFLDSIEIQAADDAAIADVRARVQALLPAGFETLDTRAVADESAAEIKDGLSIFTTALLVFAGISLFVATFLVLNTFSILVAQRTKELALLRALGASRRQVIGSVLFEALVTGLLASGLGILFGLGAAAGLRALFNRIGIELPTTETVILPRTIVVALVLGVVVTCVAATLPARKAAMVPPVAAMRDDIWVAPGRSLRLRAALGTLLLLGGMAMLALGLFGEAGDALTLVGAGAAATFLGVTVLSPLVTTPLALVVGYPFRRTGVIGQVARENAARNPRRTAATAAALMVGLALVSAVTVFTSSLRDSAAGIIDREVRADFIVTSESFFGQPGAVRDALAALPQVRTAASVRGGSIQVDGRENFATAMDPAEVPDVLALDVTAGRLADLGPGTILVGAEEAAKRGYRVGSSVQVGFAKTGEFAFRVVGLYEGNQLTGPYLIPLETFNANFTSRVDQLAAVRLADGVRASDGKRAVESALTAFPGTKVQDRTDIKKEQQDGLNQLLGIVLALLGLTIFIALLGITNTLALSVHERTRELGLLRAIGASRRQVRRLIRIEAVLIAAIGATLGLGVGIGLGSALVRALEGEGIDTLTIPPVRLAIYFVAACLAGLLAAALPAWRASRLDVLKAISHD